MIFLVLAILASALIPVLFRGFADWRIHVSSAIPINYLTCVLIGGIWGGQLEPISLLRQPWLWLALLQGVILAVNFFLLAYTAQRAGVSVAALASRLSVAIPSILAFLLYRDTLTIVKLTGLCAALLSLYLCTISSDRRAALASSFGIRFLPVLVFFTFGCYFVVIKYAQAHFLSETSFHFYVMAGFLFAFLSSLIICLARGLLTLSQVRLLDVVAGVLLGAVNYLAVYALVKALALKGWQSSQLLPIYSVGVIGISSLLAVLFFSERLSRQKRIGLAVGVVAVVLLNQ